jgi:hypothetical protein
VGKRVVTGRGTLLASATLVASGKIRTNLSMTHLFSAARFSRDVGRLEATHAGAPFGEFFEEILANASASILLAVAGLEAFANELFIDHRQHLPAVTPQIVERVWVAVERRHVLSKIDMALVLQGCPALDQSRRPAQDVNVLVELRNSLTHFKPEWQDQAVKHDQLDRVLRPRIKPTPFLPGPELLFPRRWASHDCTAWAVGAAVAVMRHAEVALGSRSRTGKFQARLVG